MDGSSLLLHSVELKRENLLWFGRDFFNTTDIKKTVLMWFTTAVAVYSRMISLEFVGEGGGHCRNR